MMNKQPKIITSPSSTLKVLKNFPLKKIEKTFVIAEFERPIRMYHVRKIVNAMVNNEFFDIVIHVVQKRNGQYEIIDGQHRITALKELRDKHFVIKYNLMLMIVPEKLSRKVYRRINLGQPLRMEEHLRALDNDNHPFFTKLKPYFVHYNDGRMPKYEMILNALHYSKNGSPRAIRPMFLDRMFNNITPEDLRIIILFSKALKKIEPIIPRAHQSMYMYAIFRNMFRVGYENNFSQADWEDFISLCKTDKFIYTLHRDRSLDAIRSIYSHMAQNIGKKMRLELQTIKRTNAQARQILDQTTSPYKMPISS